MARIQIIVILINLLFLAYIARLIVKGNLREEYAIVWIICTLLLIIFSIWRKGLDVMAKIFGIYEPPNLVFTAFIFIMLIYLLHLSVVASKLHSQNKKVAQDIALLREELKELKNKK